MSIGEEPLPELLEKLQKVSSWDKAVDREVKRSIELSKKEFYTEATLRLGRALEAGIYAVARLMNIDLTTTAKINYELESVQTKLERAQDKIWLSRDPNNIVLLSDVMKGLADAMATFVQAPEEQLSKTGKIQPRSNPKLYGSLAEKVMDPALRAKIRAETNQVISIQDIRNSAAHTALDGSEREIGLDKFTTLIQKFITVIEILFEVFIAETARITGEEISGKQAGGMINREKRS